MVQRNSHPAWNVQASVATRSPPWEKSPITVQLGVPMSQIPPQRMQRKEGGGDGGEGEMEHKKTTEGFSVCF